MITSPQQQMLSREMSLDREVCRKTPKQQSYIEHVLCSQHLPSSSCTFLPCWTDICFCRQDTYFRSILQMWVSLAFPEPHGSIRYWESITMARTAPIRGASSCSTETATSMHMPFGKSVLHVLQRHIQDGITLVMKLLSTWVRTWIRNSLSAYPCCYLQCRHWTVLGVPGGVLHSKFVSSVAQNRPQKLIQLRF